MTSVPTYQVDAFTSTRFSGNPAAVCILSEQQTLDDRTLQLVAAEMNLSETAYVRPFSDKGHYELRWFTPLKEVRLCGHATMASAVALLEGQGVRETELTFHTVYSGQLIVTRSEDKLYHLDLPKLAPNSPLPGSSDMHSQLLQALLGPCNLDLADELLYSEHVQYLLLPLKEGTSRQQLEAIRPDFRGMERASTGGQIFAVIVTARDVSEEYDFLLRFFAPWGGVDEDPVTGSAHAVAGPFWAERLGKQRLTSRQCSPRGGDVFVTNDARPGRVDVAGAAVIVLRGVLHLE